MQYLKTQRSFRNKYLHNFKKHAPELLKMYEQEEMGFNKLQLELKNREDNSRNYRYFDEKLNDWRFVRKDTKHYLYSDPNCQDNKSIQYAGGDKIFLILKNKHTNEWEFPTTPMLNGQLFTAAKECLHLSLSGDHWQVRWHDRSPNLMIRRDLFSHEKPELGDLYTGARSYYFHAYHHMNHVKLLKNPAHPYIDYVWATKGELNKYFAEDYYSQVINALID